jgi:hypothetical protein
MHIALNKSTIETVAYSIGLSCLFLTYEIHARNYQFEVLGTFGIFIILLASALLANKNEDTIRIQPTAIACALAALLLCYPIIGYVIFSSTKSGMESAKPIIQLFLCFALIFALHKTGPLKLMLVAVYICAFCSIISVIIYIFNGFLYWEMFFNRSMSIFFDPNYASAIIGFGFISAINLTKNRRILLAICLTGCFLAFSKATTIAIIISTVFYFYCSIPKLRLPIISFAILSAFVFLSVWDDIFEFISQNIPALRLEMGMNLRDIYWKLGSDTVIQDPLSLRTSSDVVNLISSYGINTSLHNTYIETAYLYSLPISFLLIVTIALSILGYVFSEKYSLAAAMLYLAVSANNFTFMLGSPNALSFFFTLLIFGGVAQFFHKRRLSTIRLRKPTQSGSAQL